MKLYNEKEIGVILKRAAEMSQDESGPNAAGLSIEELQQVGAEAGLDPDLIIRAAAEMQQGSTRRKRNVLVGPTNYSNDFVLEGEVDAATWEEMLAAVRSTFKDPGVVSTRENVFEWTSQSETEKAQVTALNSGGKTKITLFWSEPVLVLPMVIPTIIGTIISLPITFEALELTGLAAVAVVLSTFLTLLTLGRFVVNRITDQQVAKLKQLETSLDLIASKKALRSARKQAARTETDTTGPLLDLGEPSHPEQTQTGTQQRDRA